MDGRWDFKDLSRHHQFIGDNASFIPPVWRRLRSAASVENDRIRYPARAVNPEIFTQAQSYLRCNFFGEGRC